MVIIKNLKIRNHNLIRLHVYIRKFCNEKDSFYKQQTMTHQATVNDSNEFQHQHPTNPYKLPDSSRIPPRDTRMRILRLSLQHRARSRCKRQDSRHTRSLLRNKKVACYVTCEGLRRIVHTIFFRIFMFKIKIWKTQSLMLILLIISHSYTD